MSAVLDSALRAAHELAELDDAEFGLRLLAATPTHEGRDRATLRRWAVSAAAFGAALGPVPNAANVVESDGGLAAGLLARYTSRPPTVELYADAIDAAEELAGRLGWRHWFPPGSVRAAALAHESVHELLHHGPGKAALKRSLGHVVLRLGSRRVYGHVVGADEVAAHAYAAARCGLGRSPLLLTAAMAATAAPPTSPPATASRSTAPGRVTPVRTTPCPSRHVREK